MRFYSRGNYRGSVSGIAYDVTRYIRRTFLISAILGASFDCWSLFFRGNKFNEAFFFLDPFHAGDVGYD